MLKVVVVEDNASIREGLKILIDGTEGYSCVSVFSDSETMLKNIAKINPDVLLMDLGLPGMGGIEGIKKVKSLLPDLTILVLTVYEENDLVFEAICAGASGYLVKKTPPSKLLEAIKEAYEGGSPMSSHIARKVIDFFSQRDGFLQTKKTVSPPKNDYTLTPREKEILSGLVEGHNFKSIADSLFISIETVRYHFRNIYKKLHVHSQSEAVAKAIKEGII
ncbi:MAG: DNA-binding response regulator [Ignavibacteria bacterium GWB2_36_8]|nr:MAG: DNA-binding response regulator [Ignavibacteria bacterium GWB2_36_8]